VAPNGLKSSAVCAPSDRLLADAFPPRPPVPQGLRNHARDSTGPSPRILCGIRTLPGAHTCPNGPRGERHTPSGNRGSTAPPPPSVPTPAPLSRVYRREKPLSPVCSVKPPRGPSPAVHSHVYSLYSLLPLPRIVHARARARPRMLAHAHGSPSSCCCVPILHGHRIPLLQAAFPMSVGWGVYKRSFRWSSQPFTRIHGDGFPRVDSARTQGRHAPY